MNFFNNLPPVTKNIIIINVLVFLLQLIIPTVTPSFSLHFFKSPNFEPYQLLTHMFMHDPHGFTHILFNMFGVFMFGSALEQRMGSQKFFIYYLLTGFGAIILYTASVYVEKYELISYFELLKQGNLFDLVKFSELTSSYFSPSDFDEIQKELAPLHQTILSSENYNFLFDSFLGTMLGASGALFGLLAGFGTLYPNQRIMLLFPPIPIKAKYFVLFYAGYELFRGVSNAPGDNIAHFAHLGGALFGFLIIRSWRKKGFL